MELESVIYRGEGWREESVEVEVVMLFVFLKRKPQRNK
jgi:hypothetical protein